MTERARRGSFCFTCDIILLMKIQVISLFPEIFPSVLNSSMLWKAQEKKLVELSYINLRDFGLGKRKSVDDTPYGGGDGMLFMVEPLFNAVNFAKNKVPNSEVILLTPRGQTYKQSIAKSLLENKLNKIFVCAHYEGYDERITSVVDKQISIGNYVLTGGEIPAMIIIDSVVRLIPGVLGGEQSAEIESFSDDNNLEYPQYTRPQVFNGLKVPDVLVNGNHKDIQTWRDNNSKIN